MNEANQNNQSISNSSNSIKNWLSVLKLMINSKKTAVELVSAASIDHQTEFLLKFMTVIMSLVLFLLVIGLFLTHSKVNQYQVIKKQIVTTQNQSLDLTNAQEFLAIQSKETEMIVDSLPNETNLVKFIETMELIAGQHSVNRSIKFSALAPTGSGPQKYIPFVITMTADQNNFTGFLSKIEKLPYMVEVTSIETHSNNLATESMDINISAKVYVQDPFKPSLQP